jgi:hypothetical protein
MSHWPWLALVGLGAMHGINPAMGWLFAVFKGLQEQSGRALRRSLAPIAAGHALSVALAIALIAATGSFVSQRALGIAGAALLVGFGLWKLLARRTHPRWVGMQLGARELGVWSFLMSTAHGAGLMLFPVVLGAGFGVAGFLKDGGVAGIAGATLVAALVHTLAMLAVMALVAWLIFRFVGVDFLRRGWVNLDRVWAMALMLAGGVTLFS